MVVGSEGRGEEECEGDTNTAQCFLSEKLHQGSISSDLTFKQCQLLCFKSKLTCGGGSHIWRLTSLLFLMLQREILRVSIWPLRPGWLMMFISSMFPFEIQKEGAYGG